MLLFRIGGTFLTLFWALFGMTEKDVVVIDPDIQDLGGRECKKIHLI
jgi:hypothetical protein